MDTQPAHRAARVLALGEVKREEEEARLRSIIDHLTILVARAGEREPQNSNNQLQHRILEDMQFLRRAVNTILENCSQSNSFQNSEQGPYEFNPQ